MTEFELIHAYGGWRRVVECACGGWLPNKARAIVAVRV